MTTRNRLTARAQMHGEIREPGYVFTLEDGALGPHKTVPKASVDSQITDHLGTSGELIDIPLYEEISEEHEDDVLKVDGEAGYPEQAAVVEARREDDAALVELGTLQAPDDEVYAKPAEAEANEKPMLLDAPGHKSEDKPIYMTPVVVDPLPPSDAVSAADAPKAD